MLKCKKDVHEKNLLWIPFPDIILFVIYICGRKIMARNFICRF